VRRPKNLLDAKKRMIRMKTPSFLKGLWVVVMLLLVAGTGWAAVTSQGVTMGAASAGPVYIPLKLSSAQQVAGINGQLNFNTARLESPSIQVGPGASNFIALGNETTPGHFRFVLYSDPVKAMNLAQPVAYFRILSKPIDTSAVSYVETLSFSSGSNDIGAGDPNATSLGATFSDIKLTMGGNAAHDWAYYE
jgi:hypothetical protein